MKPSQWTADALMHMMSRRKQPRPIRMQDDDEGPPGVVESVRGSSELERNSNEGMAVPETFAAGDELPQCGESSSSRASSEDDVLVPETQECASYPESLPPPQPMVEASSEHHPYSYSHFAATHVTLEALENTKVAVAQFAATALANGADAASLKDLARLQSSLHTLHNQQMFQINLIHELQSKVAGNVEVMTDPDKDEPETSEREDEMDDSTENGVQAQDYVGEPLSNHPVCYETPPSPESSIITDHGPPEPFNNIPNSLEMLQRGAQEALDTASQGLLAGNLVDELTRRQPSDEARSDAQKHRCRYCGKVFGSDSALQIHLRSHTGERPFSCRVCGTRFTTKGNLKVHFQRHTDDQAFYGVLPEWNGPQRDKPSTQTWVSAGVEEPLDDEPHIMNDTKQCPICFQICACMKSLQMHILSHQKPIEEIPKPEQIEGDSIDQTFTRKSRSGSRRDRQRRPAKPVADDRNSRNLRSRSNQSKDDAKPNTSFHGPDDGSAPLDLTADSKPVLHTKDLQELLKHSPSPKDTHDFWNRSPTNMLQSHANPMDPNYSSPVGLGYNPMMDLMNGFRGNTTCNVCYKTFACHSALEIHYRSHTKERPFKCSVCERCFSTKGNMKQHFMTHKLRGENGAEDVSESHSASTPDSTCSMSTSSRDNEVDRSIEDGQMEDGNDPTDYSKNLLAPSFGQEENKYKDLDTKTPKMVDDKRPIIDMHVETMKAFEALRTPATFHTDVSPESNGPPPDGQPQPVANNKHWCNVCRRHFSSSSALQIHGRTHTGDRPFCCSVCQKSFTTKGNLKVHMSTHMWTHGVSRRGRRMTLDLPAIPTIPPTGLTQRDTEFIQRRPDLFYPYNIPATFMGRLFPKY